MSAVTVNLTEQSKVEINHVTSPVVSIAHPEVRAITVTAYAPLSAQLIPSGGTDGQVLTKASDADYDVEWTTIEEATAPALNDLTDVDTSGVTNGQTIIYTDGSWAAGDAGTDINSLSDVGDITITDGDQYDFLMYNGTNWINALPKIDAQIEVTNEDLALGQALGKTYAPGTDIITILTDILSNYYEAEITLNALKIQKENTDGSYGSTITSSSTYNLVEVGQGFKLVGFTYSVDKPSQTTDNSVTIYAASGIIESGFSDTATSADISPVYVYTWDPSSFGGTAISNGYTSLPIRLSVIDTNGPTIEYSNYKYLTHGIRVRVGTSTTETITSNAEATTLFGEITDIYNSFHAPGSFAPTGINKGDLTVSGSSDSANASNYFWIAYPSAWGEASDILLGATGSLIDFDGSDAATPQAPLEFDVTNDYGFTTSYYFYRTDSPGSILSTDNVTIQFA